MGNGDCRDDQMIHPDIVRLDYVNVANAWLPDKIILNKSNILLERLDPNQNYN